MNTISLGSHTARPSILGSSSSVYGSTISGDSSSMKSKFAAAVHAAQTPAPAPVAPTSGSRVRALFEYTKGSGRSDLLPFKMGDVFTQLDSVSKDWARGRLDDGREGLFPIAYV
jgi:SH3 domain